MDRLVIIIAVDGLSAEARFVAGSPQTAAAVRAAVRDAGITYGIDDRAMAELVARLEQSFANGSLVVARGLPAEDGVDGHVRMEPRGAQPGVRPGRAGHDGSIDYRERDLLHPVAADEVIAHLVEPTPGTAGQDVRGRRLLPRAGRPLRVHVGPGVRVEQHTAYATRDGVLLLDQKRLDVVPLYEHRGDVDYHSGNLRSGGSIAVRGDVQPGFTVAASGDVRVSGTVFDAELVAGGSVQVDQGVLGAKAWIRAGGRITCRHATSSRLEADGEVHLGDEAIHCIVRGASVHATGGRGAIVGGEVRARSRIAVKVAGSAAGAPTVLAVGDVSEEVVGLVRATNLDDKVLVGLRGRARNGGFGAGDGKALRTAARADDDAQAERLRLAQRRRELLRTASVEVSGTLHTGVRVEFGDVAVELDEPRQHVRLFFDPDTNTIRQQDLR